MALDEASIGGLVAQALDAFASATSTAELKQARLAHIGERSGLGLANREIALELNLGESTVKTHVKRILMKLALRDRVHAIVYAYETGLLAPGHRDP